MAMPLPSATAAASAADCAMLGCTRVRSRSFRAPHCPAGARPPVARRTAAGATRTKVVHPVLRLVEQHTVAAVAAGRRGWGCQSRDVRERGRHRRGQCPEARPGTVARGVRANQVGGTGVLVQSQPAK